MAQNESYKIQVVIEGQDRASTSLMTVNRELDKMDGSVKKTSVSWSGFKEGVTTAIGAFAIAGGFAAIVGQINELGTAANAAERTFNQVSGGADKAAESLARMRSLTGGVIDDMTLMKGASSLLVTGIADTNEQAEELVNLGSRLSAVMGVDAAEGISNLNSALLNNSFMRLDTLGISAAAVRERVNELKEAGMDMSEAFSAAVLEIGNKTLTDLGDAAGVAETAVARLTTGFQNMAQDLGQWVNVEVEKLAVTLEQIGMLGAIATGNDTGNAQIDAQIASMEELRTLTEQYEAQLKAMDASIPSWAVPSDSLESSVASFFANNPELAEQFATAGDTASTYFRDAFNSGNEQTIQEATNLLSQVMGEDLSDFSLVELQTYATTADLAFTSSANAVRDLRVETDALAVSEAEAALQAERIGQAQAGLDFNSLEANATDYLATIRLQSDALEELATAGQISTSGSSFFNPAHLAEVQNQAEAVNAEYEHLKMMQEADEFSLVTEEEVERAREIAEAANETAEQAERNAIAWEKASLAMIAGATGGGRENEFYQMVLAGIEDPEQRAALEQQFNLQSGTETVNTMVTEYAAALNMALIDEFGTGRGSQMGQEIYLALEEGIAAGLEGEELKTYIEERVGYALSGMGTGAGGEEITVQANEGYIALAERTGYTREELEAATGGGMLMAGQVITMPDGSSLIAIGENATPEEISNTILGNASSAISNAIPATAGNNASVPFIYSDQYQSYIGDTGSHSGQTLATDNTTGEVVYITSEQGEIIGEATEDIASMDASLQTIAETDTSLALDPMIGDMDELQMGLNEFETSMTRLSTTQFNLEVPIAFVFDTQTAEMLSRNSQVVETVRLILPQLGVTPS